MLQLLEVQCKVKKGELQLVPRVFQVLSSEVHRLLVCHERSGNKSAYPAVVEVGLLRVIGRVNINELKLHGVHVIAVEASFLITKVTPRGQEVVHLGIVQRIVCPDLLQLHEDHDENPVDDEGLLVVCWMKGVILR